MNSELLTDDLVFYAVRWPCVGCGYCCKKAPCFLSQRTFGDQKAGECPALRYHDGRYWCGLVEDGDETVKRELAIGAGCSSALFNTVRDDQIRRQGT